MNRVKQRLVEKYIMLSENIAIFSGLISMHNNATPDKSSYFYDAGKFGLMRIDLTFFYFLHNTIFQQKHCTSERID